MQFADHIRPADAMRCWSPESSRDVGKRWNPNPELSPGPCPLRMPPKLEIRNDH
jgi:hypothetical protein